MEWMAVKISFAETNDDALMVDLITAMFQDVGTKGVVVDDPHLSPVEGWGSDAVALPATPAVTAYLPVDGRLEERRVHIEKALKELARRQPLRYTLEYQAVDEQDWAESWKAFFYPEAITPTIVVKPTWRDYTPEPNQKIIEIDPGMAFGTGTHPTTALCIQLLEKHLKQDQSVLDVGTGSGILLIASRLLGAGHLCGIDNDEQAVAIARENLLKNNIPPEDFQLHSGHLVDTVDRKFQVVVANILADVIMELLDQVPSRIAPGGLFVCSGIIEAYRDKVAQKMAAGGFDIVDLLERGEWVALAGRLE